MKWGWFRAFGAGRRRPEIRDSSLVRTHAQSRARNGELLDISAETRPHPVVATHPHVLDDARTVPSERVLDAGDGPVRLL